MDREGFQAISHIIAYKDQQIMVVVEGRRPLCWSCKQLGHLARDSWQRAVASNIKTTTTTTTTTTNNNNNNNNEKAVNTLEPGNHPNYSEEGWTQVMRNKKRNNKTTTTTTTTTESTTEPALPVVAAVKISALATTTAKTTAGTTTIKKPIEKQAKEITTV